MKKTDLKFNLADFDLAGYLKKEQAFVQGELDRILKSLDPELELTQAMAHSLMAGGKRLRPILSLATAAACGGNHLLALPAACAIEMIHTYSLIHDDLPAMDDDDLRRGLPTCHKKFSEATAVLAGDGLLTHALHLIARPGNLFSPLPSPEILLELVAEVSDAAGIHGMVEGQMMDMQAYQGTPDNLLAHLKEIHALKTGRMIRVSVLSGAIAVGASLEQKHALKTYADGIGLAFQVMDDILNVEGDPEIMGKAVGSDALHDKMTFPAIIGLDASKAYARELIDSSQDALADFGTKADPLRAIAAYIISRDR
ncbi:MAG: polyprenyl synthetase family protein [Desulfobacterales bacterium]|nr:polyprenyl synthetase family protein [Desulfobacterales bacterium]